LHVGQTSRTSCIVERSFNDDTVVYRRLDDHRESIPVATFKRTNKNNVFLGNFVIQILFQASPEVIVVASYCCRNVQHVPQPPKLV
jgi:hypothetical protein